MGCREWLNRFDKHKAFELLIGVIGVNLAFLVLGIYYEKIVSLEYLNNSTLLKEQFRYTAGLIMIQRAINWWLGQIYKFFTVKKEQRVKIPTKNTASVGLVIHIASVAMTQSMYLVSYPLIIMAKSCSLLNVILVGIFCSRVRSKQLKLGAQKIVIAAVVTVGIIMFRVFDPSTNLQDNKNSQLLGLLLLIISFFADGFIPDFQAQIKQKYKPSPIEMLVKINKWCAIWAFLHLLVTNKFFQLLEYCFYHQQFMIDLGIMSLSAFIGQIFVYRMIKQFKQHIVPFVVTTRKIVTVGLSIVYFNHQTSVGQIISIIMVFAATFYEFIDSITKTNFQKQISQAQTNNQLTQIPSFTQQNKNAQQSVQSQPKIKNLT